VMDVQNIDENYRQLNEMLEKALNSIKDDTNLSTNSNIKNKNSNDKKQSKISNHFKSDESNNLATILHEVKQDLNMTDDVYRSLTNKSNTEISIFKENNDYNNKSTSPQKR